MIKAVRALSPGLWCPQELHLLDRVIMASVISTQRQHCLQIDHFLESRFATESQFAHPLKQAD